MAGDTGAGETGANLHHVLVAIDADLLDEQHVAVSPFSHSFLRATGPEMRLAGGERQTKGFGVHPGEHQDGTVVTSVTIAGIRPSASRNGG